MDFTFGTSTKGRPVINFGNNIFTVYRKNKKQLTFWRCTRYKTHNCRAELITFANKILENSTPFHTHPATKSDVTQNYTNDENKQQVNSRKCDSFQVKAIEKQNKLKKHYSVLSSPSNSNNTNAEENENDLQALYNTNAEENKNDLQALYNTLSPADNCKDLAEMSDEEFWKPRNTSNIEKGEKSQFIQRFHTNRAAEPKARSSKSVPRKPDASKTLLRTKNILRGLCKNGKLNKKCNRKIKWLDY
jgi:hypothetical protein